MDIYWTTPTDVDTQHPRLQTSDRVEGWRDCSPKLYPLCLFGMIVQILGALDEMDLLDAPTITDCGIRAAEG